MGQEDDDDIFVDSSLTMDNEDNTSTLAAMNQDSGGDNTNSLLVREQHNTPLK
jgi:hypothetical protein